MNMKIYLMVLCATGSLAGEVTAAPVTRVQVSRPSTQTGVLQLETSGTVRQLHSSVETFHPSSSVRVTQPATAVDVHKPTTTQTVNKPATEVFVDRPATTVAVEKPSTNLSVTRPGENNWQTATGRYANTVVPPAERPVVGGKQTAEKSSSMKSSYQPPQAKDFKAAKLGGGEAGLGNKTNQAEKDAAAASLNIPKGEEVSLENVTKPSANTSSLKQKIEKKI